MRYFVHVFTVLQLMICGKEGFMFLKFSSVKEIEHFVNICSNSDSNICVQSGHTVVNGCSLLGVYSLNLAKPVEVSLNGQLHSGRLQSIFHNFNIVEA